MLERIMKMDTYVYVLWGVGVLGLLLKMMANTYLKSLIKASENMATTKKKKLQIIARKYKNRQSLGMNNCNGDTFVEKNIRKMKFAAMPFEFWRKCGNTLAFVVVALAAGSFLYYDVSWRGSPEMILFMANSVCVCAFLAALENIFLINNKVEILKANIKDYIENVTPVREPVKLRSSIRADPAGKLSEQEAAVTKTDGVKKDCTSPEMVNHIQEEVKRKQLEKEEKNDEGRASPDNDVMIDSFLREFFS